MKTNKITKLALAGICTASMLLSGCMAAALDNYNVQQFETTTQAPTSPSNIVLSTTTPECKYQNLGSISVRNLNFMGSGRSGADIKSDMQTQAAKMGGNAVIGIKHTSQFYNGSIVYITNISGCKGIQVF